MEQEQMLTYKQESHQNHVTSLAFNQNRNSSRVLQKQTLAVSPNKNSHTVDEGLDKKSTQTHEHLAKKRTNLPVLLLKRYWFHICGLDNRSLR